MLFIRTWPPLGGLIAVPVQAHVSSVFSKPFTHTLSAQASATAAAPLVPAVCGESSYTFQNGVWLTRTIKRQKEIQNYLSVRQFWGAQEHDDGIGGFWSTAVTASTCLCTDFPVPSS